MKLLTKNTDYAIRAVCFIAKKKGLSSASEIAGKLKIPEPFLRRILQVLHSKGILSSFKGKEGGFKLALACNRIFIVDLIEIFQGKVKLNECLIRKQICPEIKICILKRKIDEIEQYAVRQLKRLTIKTLLEEEGRQHG